MSNAGLNCGPVRDKCEGSGYHDWVAQIMGMNKQPKKNTVPHPGDNASPRRREVRQHLPLGYRNGT